MVARVFVLDHATGNITNQCICLVGIVGRIIIHGGQTICILQAEVRVCARLLVISQVPSLQVLIVDPQSRTHLCGRERGVGVTRRDRFGGRLKLKGGSEDLLFSEGEKGFYATNDEDDVSDVCRQGTTGKQMRSKKKRGATAQPTRVGC